MVKINSAEAEKHVNALVDGAIKSSLNHAKILLAATVATVLFAAEHGQCGPLTRLHKDVSGSDAEGIRIFIVNMSERYGVEVTGADGVDRKVSFLKFKKGEGFSLNTSDNENVLKGIKASKAAVIKAGEEVLADLPMSRMDRDAAMTEAFDSVATVKRAILALARHGDGSMARAVNKVLGNQGYTVGEIDEVAHKNDPKVKLAKLDEQRKKLETQIASAPANLNRESAPANVAVN